MLIGVVLLLAVIGLLNISGKKDDSVKHPDDHMAETSAQNNNNIKPPSISINQTSQQNKKQTGDDSVTNTPQADPGEANDTASKDNDFTPEIIEQPAQYGTLSLRAMLLGDNTPQQVNFEVFDENNKRVASNNQTDKADLQLETGQYRIIARFEQGGKTQTLARSIQVLKDQTSNTEFKFQAPVNTGVLQVSAVSGDNRQAVKTDFIIQDKSGKRVALRQHVASTVFKLESGVYKVTAKSNELSVARIITIEPGASISEVFQLKPGGAPASPEKLPEKASGRMLVRVFEEGTSHPLSAEIVITDTEGKLIKRLNAASSTDLSLKAGKYRISATGPNGQIIRDVIIAPGKPVSEIFRFKPLQKDTVANSGASGNMEPEQQEPDKNTADSQLPNKQHYEQAAENTEADKTETATSRGVLQLKAVDSETKKPIRSNFYVQTLNGKHVVNKIYANSANFKLDKGVYKITVKSKNRKPISKTMSVNSDTRLNHIFSMTSINKAPQSDNNHRPVWEHSQQSTGANSSKNEPYYSNQNNNQPAAPVRQTDAKPAASALPATGTLLVTMYPARNHKTARNALLTNFQISTRKGKRIATINSVQQATIKLDVGEYIVTAIHQNKRKSTSFKIRKNQQTRIGFNAVNFRNSRNANNTRNANNNNTATPMMGILRSRIVDQRGRPLKGNLTVTNRRGVIVRRANNVSMADFQLPAKPFTISINYHGLSASERVRIMPGETTVQTFTIAPDNSQSGASKTPQQQPEDIRDVLKQKLKEELRRVIR